MLQSQWAAELESEPLLVWLPNTGFLPNGPSFGSGPPHSSAAVIVNKILSNNFPLEVWGGRRHFKAIMSGREEGGGKSN